MDYKYIEQLLERYFQCETTLKEEEILRAFFTQEDVPVWLTTYKKLFDYEAQREEPLGDDFDERILKMIEQQEPVKARVLTLTQRMMPLFKAAAIVAIVLTLGNAAQAPWDRGWDNPQEEYAKYHQQQKDSVDILGPIQAENLMEDSINAVAAPVTPKY
ncbi:MAG: pyruvate ferredoxin oxidoreductase [Prevotella sp.]|nr:pyruvate ferredoxin oxidoreductase [Prevotella sp.]